MTHVRLDVRDHVATLTLDGPERLNSFSGDTGAELAAAYRRCDEDDAIRVVVLTGAGRAFCAGADMSAGSDAFALPGDDFSASPVDPPAWRIRKLVLAAINGHAIGIGLTLALQCDLRFVAEEAKLAIPQVRRGVLGDAHSHWTLPRLVGRAAAADLLLTGRTISGREAAQMGLANRSLPAEDVLDATLAVAHDVAINANPVSVALSKQILWSDLGPDQISAAETEAHHLLMPRTDAIEGPMAWREQRAPAWQNRVSDLPPHPLIRLTGAMRP